MKNSSFTVLVIPSLNPDDKLISLIKSACEYFSDIIIVNDGSGKDYEHIYKRIRSEYQGIHYLKHEENRGKGCALKTAMEYYLSSLATSYLGIVTADSDGQHEINDIIAIDKQLGGHGESSFVIGYRDLNSKIMPARSKFGNKVTAMLFRSLYGVKLKDTQSGLRAFSNDIIPWLMNISGDRFEYEMNVLIKSKNAEFTIYEHPINTKYEQNHKSHFRSIKDSIRVVGVLLSGMLSFILAGLVAGIVDIVAFALLNDVFFASVSSLALNLFASTVLARVLSSVVNFVFNRFVTFGGKRVSKTSIFRYYTLWFFQLFASYLIVLGLTSLMGGGEIIIKLITDLVLAMASYQIQLKWVFRKKGA